MPTISLSDLYSFDGGLVTLNIGGTNTVLLSDLSLVSPSDLNDDDLVLDQTDDGVTTLNGTTIDYIGNGTASLLGLDPRDVIAFDSGGTTYFYFPDGQPIGAGLSLTIGIDSTGSAAVCFAEGTGIATPGGDVAVEALSVGDDILTAEGRSVAVRWVGRMSLQRRMLSGAKEIVKITAGALGGGLSKRDLRVTADHGMVIDGHVVNAAALLDVPGVDWAPLAELPEDVVVYHIETDAHDVILAEGAPSETFIDAAERKLFDNYDEYMSLYGCERMFPEIALPRIASSRLLPASIKAKLGVVEEDARDADLVVFG